MTEVTKEFIQKNEDEKIIEIEIERLRSFKNHPFQVKDDNEMHLLKESIEKYGILTPLIVVFFQYIIIIIFRADKRLLFLPFPLKRKISGKQNRSWSVSNPIS